MEAKNKFGDRRPQCTPDILWWRVNYNDHSQELADRLKASPSQEDDLLREHILAVLQYWVVKCQESVSSTDQEMELLEGMTRMRGGTEQVARQPEARPHPTDQKPRPPIVITRDMIQVHV